MPTQTQTQPRHRRDDLVFHYYCTEESRATCAGEVSSEVGIRCTAGHACPRHHAPRYGHDFATHRAV